MGITMLLAAGSVVGLLAGLLDIGGGMLLVPVFTLIESTRFPGSYVVKMTPGHPIASLIPGE